MNLKNRIEKILYLTLPERVFHSVVSIYQSLKNTRDKTKHKLSVLNFHRQTDFQGKRKRIINLDMYGWIDVNILDHINKNFSNDTSILKNSISWSKYENSPIQEIIISNQDYYDYEYEKLRLWEIAKVSIMKHLGIIIIPGKTRLSNNELACVSIYYQRSINCYKTISNELETYRPDSLFLTQGGVYDSRIISELARRYEVQAIALENSFSSRHFYADSLTGQILNRHSIALTGSFINECIKLEPEDSEKKVLKFFYKSLENKADDHNTKHSTNNDKLISSLSIPKNKKVILFLGQVRTDASLILDSTIYTDPVDLIESLVNIVNKSREYFLIIRLHPKEDTMNRTMRCGNSKELCHNATLNELQNRNINNSEKVRVISDKNISTYTLMKSSNLGITINSQSGLEMSLLGLPVITAGRCFYANKGFSWDLSRKELLEHTIETAIETEFGNKEWSSLISFCHYLFFEYLIAKDFSTNANRLYRLLGINTV